MEVDKEFEKSKNYLLNCLILILKIWKKPKDSVMELKLAQADKEPFLACFTCNHLLRNITKHSSQSTIFHIDMNGALYLIIMATY